MSDPPAAFTILAAAAAAAAAADERQPDQEEVVVRFAADGHEERVRVQDYERVYAVAGLYEAIVHDHLRCQSPDRVAAMLARAARELGRAPRSVRVLDLGAGNGVSGQALAAQGLQPVVAIDTEPAARAATLRDRPGLYEAYLIADVLALTAAQARTIRALAPNALACIGAIGLDHVPPAALPAALGLLADDSLLAYTVSEATSAQDGAEITARLSEIAARWRFDELARERYRHRLTVTGHPIWWEAVVVRARRR
jgi:predicted TPR repeat methyltransferase